MSEQPAEVQNAEVQPVPTGQPETRAIPETSESVDKFKIQWVTVIVSCLFSVLVSASCIALYDRFAVPKIITLRIDQILGDHIKAIASSNLNDAQKQAMSVQWSQALDKAIKQVQNGRNIVLTQNAVVAGNTDYTDTVRYLINQNMNYTQANIANASQLNNGGGQ